MTERSFDVLTRSLGRRRVVQAFAAAGATTLSGVKLIGAKSNNGNKNKNQNKKIKKKALALCAAQVSQCVALTGDNGVGAVCCLELADCDLSGLFTCLSSQ